MKKSLMMEIPKEIVTALSRRHNGREDITRDEVLDTIAKMNLLYMQWQKASKHLDWVYDVFWEENRIEERFGTPVFYGAHRRLRNAQNNKKAIHKAMFYLLVCTDGNYEQFTNSSLDAESIYFDFMDKYSKHLTKNQ